MLKERLKEAETRQELRLLKQRRGSRDLNNLGDRFFYRLGLSNEVRVCMNGFRNLFGIFKKQWSYLKSHCGDSFVAGPIVHGNTGNRNAVGDGAAEASVIEFLNDVTKEYGEAYATRFIREITGLSLRNEEEGAVELPSSFTKRKLYTQYCFSRGYVIKPTAKGSYGSVEDYERRPFDDILWPEGTMSLPVCCWKSFLQIWKNNFPHLTIRNPCEDTCGDCFKIRNSFKILDKLNRARRAAARAEAESDVEDDENIDNVDGNNSYSDASDVEEYDFLNKQDYPEEVIIMKATKHAVHAQNQRNYAKERIAGAKATFNNPWEERRFVFCFFCSLYFRNKKVQ